MENVLTLSVYTIHPPSQSRYIWRRNIKKKFNLAELILLAPFILLDHVVKRPVDKGVVAVELTHASCACPKLLDPDNKGSGYMTEAFCVFA